MRVRQHQFGGFLVGARFPVRVYGWKMRVCDFKVAVCDFKVAVCDFKAPVRDFKAPVRDFEVAVCDSKVAGLRLLGFGVSSAWRTFESSPALQCWEHDYHKTKARFSERQIQPSVSRTGGDSSGDQNSLTNF